MTARHEVLCSIGLPTGDAVDVVRRRFQGGSGPRVAVVAGIRGDTPEGVRVAHQVASFLAGVHDQLAGTVDVYPCVNPLAAHRGARHWPFFDQDLNRRFPGRPNGHAPDHVAWALVQDLAGIDQLIEVRGAHPAFSEVPQAQVRATDSRAAELARHGNVQVVWTRHPGPAAPSTLAWQFPETIVLEGGTGNRLSTGVGRNLAHGVLNMLAELEVLTNELLPFHWAGMTRPPAVGDTEVHRVRSGAGGLFLPEVGVWDELEPSTLLGTVVDPITGACVERIVSPSTGRVMAVREQPVIFPGTMVARVVEAALG